MLSNDDVAVPAPAFAAEPAAPLVTAGKALADEESTGSPPPSFFLVLLPYPASLLPPILGASAPFKSILVLLIVTLCSGPTSMVMHA